MEKQKLEFWTSFVTALLSLVVTTAWSSAQARGPSQDAVLQDRGYTFPNPVKVVDARPRLALQGGRPGALGAVILGGGGPSGDLLGADLLRVGRFDARGRMVVELPCRSRGVEVLYAQGALVLGDELVAITTPVRVEQLRGRVQVHAASGRQLGSTFYGSTSAGRGRLAAHGLGLTTTPLPELRAGTPESGEGVDGRSGKTQTIPQEAEEPPDVEELVGTR